MNATISPLTYLFSTFFFFLRDRWGRSFSVLLENNIHVRLGKIITFIFKKCMILKAKLIFYQTLKYVVTCNQLRFKITIVLKLLNQITLRLRLVCVMGILVMKCNFYGLVVLFFPYFLWIFFVRIISFNPKMHIKLTYIYIYIYIYIYRKKIGTVNHCFKVNLQALERFILFGFVYISLFSIFYFTWFSSVQIFLVAMFGK
jgi:hypothetical protein